MIIYILQIAECERDITEREKLLAKVQEQEKTLTQTFVGSIGDNNKFKDFILKVRYMLHTKFVVFADSARDSNLDQTVSVNKILYQMVSL